MGVLFKDIPVALGAQTSHLQSSLMVISWHLTYIQPVCMLCAWVGHNKRNTSAKKGLCTTCNVHTYVRKLFQVSWCSLNVERLDLTLAIHWLLMTFYPLLFHWCFVSHSCFICHDIIMMPSSLPLRARPVFRVIPAEIKVFSGLWYVCFYLQHFLQDTFISCHFSSQCPPPFNPVTCPPPPFSRKQVQQLLQDLTA